MRNSAAEIAAIKSSAASRFDELAEQFVRSAEAHGTKVFRTSDPQAVNDYILRLAQQQGVKTVVKSKSMATEEIHLNKHLQAAGH